MTQIQSVLAPAGPRAEPVVDLFWFSVAISAVVYVVVVGLLAWALRRGRLRRQRGEHAPADAERRMTLGVGAGIGVTVIILLVYFGYDLAVGRVLRLPTDRPHAMVSVTGHQWWWQVEYPDSVPSRWVTDANEIHIPTGRPVLVELKSVDVIHSLWIPNLGGKKDLIPRYRDTVWFQADTPGVYRSQCAEFCGHQHAKMALYVVAHEPAEFEKWLERARRPAPEPTDTLTRRGREVFLSGPCAICHAIQGTLAGSNVGPDLTHLASRRSLAAGTLPNTIGNLAGWIMDPQRVKPGVAMPPNPLAPADLEALLAYLQTLR